MCDAIAVRRPAERLALGKCRLHEWLLIFTGTTAADKVVKYLWLTFPGCAANRVTSGATWLGGSAAIYAAKSQELMLCRLAPRMADEHCCAAVWSLCSGRLVRKDGRVMIFYPGWHLTWFPSDHC
jgi:hypothetical protein